MSKKIMALLTATLLALSLFTACGKTAPTVTGDGVKESETLTGSGDTTLTIWDWDAAHLEHMTAFYQETHPEISFETLVVKTDDYMQKLQSALATDLDIPDILLGELGFRGRLFDLGIMEDLSQAPYNVKKEDMFDFATELGQGPNGELLGVEQQICPSGFAFRRDLAKEYLGTDDPAEVSELIKDWDAFTEVGKKVIEASSGEVTIFPGTTVLMNTVLKNQEPFPYIDGDSIDLTGRYYDVFAQGLEIYNADILGNQESGTPALSTGVTDGDFIFYPCAPWSVKWDIASANPNDSGKWGLVKAPGNGFTYGGTSVGIYANSPAKEAAWEYIQFTYCDGDGVKEAFEQFGFMTGFTAPYQDESSYFFSEGGAYDEFFGGQKLASYFINEISISTKGQVQSKNEVAILSAFGGVLAQIANDKNITAEEAIELFISEVETSLPNAVVK